MDSQRLKSIQLEMLKCFVDICEKLNLRYYVVGGTLLGAIRHHGFIPWDDDIDVGLPREDYEIFIREAQSYLPEFYFLQNRQTDPELPCNFSKIRDCRTTFIEKSVRHLKINHGAYIDIFPIDFYPDSKVKQRIFDIKNKLLSFRISQIFSFSESEKSLFKYLRNKTALVFLILRYPTIAGALNAREELYKKEKRGALVANFCGAWGRREILPASWLAETFDVKFEGMILKAPKEYDKYLRHLYGDYMKYPPVEKQVSHHYTEIIDLDAPYSKYISK